MFRNIIFIPFLLCFTFLSNAQGNENSQYRIAGDNAPSVPAMLHFYRFDGYGFLIGYNIYLNDSIICRSKNKWKTTVAVYAYGENRIFGKTESGTELFLTLEPGKEYYIKCAVGVGKPRIDLMDNETGKREYETLKKVKKK